MKSWLRWGLGVIAPIVGIFAGIATREWRDDILNAFPFFLGSGPISWRAVAFWTLVCIPVLFAGTTFYVTRQAELKSEHLRTSEDDAHARALALTLSNADDGTGLWIANRGTHVLNDLEVVAIPDDERPQDLPPLTTGGGSTQVRLTYPILGGWFLANIEQLNPGKGLRICVSALSPEHFTRFEFDISWHDHTGKQRKSHAVADLRTVTHEIELQPRLARTSAA
jgi:hypothetical protein